jgi:hypothetical protein
LVGEVKRPPKVVEEDAGREWWEKSELRILLKYYLEFAYVWM